MKTRIEKSMQSPEKTDGAKAMSLRLIACALGLASLSVLPTSVSAQSDNQASLLEEVVVTARRRQESLQDVPISISALDASFLERAAISQHEDLQYHVPGLNATTAGARKDTLGLSLRGQRNNDVLGVSDPAVATYFGDALISRPIGTNQALYDLESVEVLHGVQGTLFGRNTTGGALVINPAPPTGQMDAMVKVTYGDYDHMELNGMLNLPLGDKAALRVAGKVFERDGLFENIETGEELDSRDLGAYRASLLLTPSDRVKSLTIYDYYEHDQASNALSFWAFNPTAGTVRGLAGRRAQAAEYPFFPSLGEIPDQNELLAEQRALGPYKVRSDVGAGRPGVDIYGGLDSTAENWGIQNSTTVEFEGFSIKNILAYRELEIDTVVDLDGSLNGGISSGQTGDGEFFSEEFQVLGTALDGKLDWIAGLYYMSEEGVDDSSSMQFNDLRIEGTRIGVYNAVIAPDGSNFDQAVAAANAAAAGAAVQNHTSGLYENSSTAIYTGLTYRPIEQLTVSGGLRYTEDERESTATHRSLNISSGVSTCQYVRDGAQLPIGECNPTVDDKWEAWTYDVTLAYNFSDASMLYGSFRHGYKTGGFNGRARNDNAATPFDEEVVDEYELGIKSDFELGGTAARFNGAVFRQDYTDIQRQTALNFGDLIVTVINNAAEATIQGGEFELLLVPSNDLQLNLFYSWIDGEYDSFVDQARGIDRSDEWLIQPPEHMYGGTLTYSYTLADSSELVLTLNGYRQGRAHLDDVDVEADQESYSLVNARLDWARVAGSKFSLGIWARNLTDEEYGVGTVSILDTSAGSSGRVWGNPRTYGIDVTYRLGD